MRDYRAKVVSLPTLVLLESYMKQIVFLHGYGARKTQFEKVKNYLHKFGNVFAPELPGLIDEKSLDSHSYSAYCNWLKVFMDKQNPEKVILIGNSFGAAVALHFVHKFPEKLEKVILVEPPLPLDYPLALYMKFYMGLRKVFTNSNIPYFMKEWFVRKTTGATMKLDEAELLNRISAINDFAKYEFEPAEFKVPVVVLWGNADNSIHPYSQGKDWVSKWQGAGFIEYDGDVGTIYVNPEKLGLRL